MTILPTYEAQRRISVHEWRELEPWQRELWQLILLACQSPGIPADDLGMRRQLTAVWGQGSETLERLLNAPC